MIKKLRTNNPTLWRNDRDGEISTYVFDELVKG